MGALEGRKIDGYLRTGNEFNSFVISR